MFETAVAEKVLTIEEYLKMEDSALEKHEFDNEILFDISGALIPHNVVKGRFFYLLEQLFEEKSLPFFTLDSDVKVRVEKANRFYYPDVTVIMDEPEYYTSPSGKLRRDTITNPILIVEVFSKKTRERDKGEKFDNYCTLPTFREYVLVEPEKNWVKTQYLQDPGKGLWEIHTYTDPEDVFRLYSISCDMKVADIYSRLAKMKNV